MRFGLFGGPARRTPQMTDREAYGSYVEGVLEAERLGFYGAYLVEHHFTQQGQVSASLALLNYLAALTSTIRLGTAVVVTPWHNPVLLAEQAATLDVLSNGRLDLGLGRGYRDYEFHGFGVPKHEADSRFSETLKLLRIAWTSSERFSFTGKHWSFNDIIVDPKPVQHPTPPLWVGAASHGSIEAAARNGLRLFLDQVATFEEVKERLSVYRNAQADAGIRPHPHDVALTRPLLLANNRRERTKALESQVATLTALAGSTGQATDNPFHSDPASRHTRVEAGAIIGTATECTERLQHLVEIGVQQVLFTRTTPSTLKRFADNVMPNLANAN